MAGFVRCRICSAKWLPSPLLSWLTAAIMVEVLHEMADMQAWFKAVEMGSSSRGKSSNHERWSFKDVQSSSTCSCSSFLQRRLRWLGCTSFFPSYFSVSVLTLVFNLFRCLSIFFKDSSSANFAISFTVQHTFYVIPFGNSAFSAVSLQYAASNTFLPGNAFFLVTIK